MRSGARLDFYLPVTLERPFEDDPGKSVHRLSCLGAASGEFPRPRSRSQDAKRRTSRLLLSGSSQTTRVPPIKQPLALGVVSTRFRAPQAKGAEKGDSKMYLSIQFRSSVSSAKRFRTVIPLYPKAPYTFAFSESCNAFRTLQLPSAPETVPQTGTVRPQACPSNRKKSDAGMKGFSLKGSVLFLPISKNRGQLSLDSSLASGEGK